MSKNKPLNVALALHSLLRHLHTMNTLRIYGLYFAQFVKARLAYKWDFFGALVASFFSTLGGVVFVLLLIDGKEVPSLKDWNREEVLFIYGFSLLSTSLFGIFSPNLYRFGDRYIIEGQFDRVLLRPLNSLLQILFESFNLDSIGTFLLGITIIFYTGMQLGISFGIVDFAWLIVAVVSGAVILLSVFTILASASFHFEDRLGLVPPMYNLVMFSRYPLPIFNRLIQILLSVIIPFAFVSFFPAMHFFEERGFAGYCYLTPAVAMICAFFAWGVWNFGVSRYASTGN